MHPSCNDIVCRIMVVPMSSTMSTWQTCMRLSLRRRSAIHCSMHQQRRLRQPRQPRQQHRPHQATSGHIRPHQATSGRIRPHQAASGKQHQQHQPHQQRQLQQPRQPRPQHQPHRAASGRTPAAAAPAEPISGEPLLQGISPTAITAIEAMPSAASDSMVAAVSSTHQQIGASPSASSSAGLCTGLSSARRDGDQ